MKKLLHEPLLHFLLIGAGLFLIFGLTRPPAGNAPNRIVVDAGQVEQLTANFTRTWMRPPTGTELAGLIDNYIRDEVYYREALTMGLDQNDPLIRRRMRQKMEFIFEDLSTASVPSDQVLTDFLKQHADRFYLEPRISFRQVYLNPDKRRNLEADASRMLADLQAGAAPETLGDPTLVGYTFHLASQSMIRRTFGKAFGQEVSILAQGKWTGPLYSGVGAHLVFISERQEGRLPDLSEIRDRVENEWLARHRREQKARAYAKLLEGYQVVIEPSNTKENSPGTAMAAPSQEVGP